MVAKNFVEGGGETAGITGRVVGKVNDPRAGEESGVFEE